MHDVRPWNPIYSTHRTPLPHSHVCATCLAALSPRTIRRDSRLWRSCEIRDIAHAFAFNGKSELTHLHIPLHVVGCAFACCSILVQPIPVGSKYLSGRTLVFARSEDNVVEDSYRMYVIVMGVSWIFKFFIPFLSKHDLRKKMVFNAFLYRCAK